MSTWKHADKDVVDESKDEFARTMAEDEIELPPPPAVKVTSLELDVDDDAGSDPYNRTGQFCVPTFDKRDKD